jgi:D-aminopeptidase
MKVHIISDMEGVAGIVKWEQTTGGDPMYEEGRRLYTEEINAAIRGAKTAGATEIVVMDCHGAGGAYDFNSLLPELLDPACEYVVQQEWTEYTSFLEVGCDAALFVGMHAMAGTPESPTGCMSRSLPCRRRVSLPPDRSIPTHDGTDARARGAPPPQARSETVSSTRLK